MTSLSVILIRVLGGGTLKQERSIVGKSIWTVIVWTTREPT